MRVGIRSVGECPDIGRRAGEQHAAWAGGVPVSLIGCPIADARPAVVRASRKSSRSNAGRSIERSVVGVEIPVGHDVVWSAWVVERNFDLSPSPVRVVPDVRRRQWLVVGGASSPLDGISRPADLVAASVPSLPWCVLIPVARAIAATGRFARLGIADIVQSDWLRVVVGVSEYITRAPSQERHDPGGVAQPIAVNLPTLTRPVVPLDAMHF